jgi:hypothetical protein
MFVYSDTAVNTDRMLLKITTLRGLQWRYFHARFHENRPIYSRV